jgi:translation initiation factor 2A
MESPKQPASSHFYNLNGNKKDEIAKHHRNTVKFNPFGTLFLIAGFGNLHGDVDIYERESMRLVGSCRASSTVYCEWAPCGRVFVAATLCPRMRVDNGYAVYKYTGEMLVRVAEPVELWQFAWKPQTFQWRQLTPDNRAKVVAEKKAYRPPGASSGFAERFKAAKESAPGKLQNKEPTPTPAQDFIPGLAPEPAKKKKKKKKNANK